MLEPQLAESDLHSVFDWPVVACLNLRVCLQLSEAIGHTPGCEPLRRCELQLALDLGVVAKRFHDLCSLGALEKASNQLDRLLTFAANLFVIAKADQCLEEQTQSVLGARPCQLL